MNFDIFDDIEVPNKYRGKVINGAKAAERNIKVSPYNALLNARVSLENLCKSLIHTKNLPKLEGDKGTLAHRILEQFYKYLLQRNLLDKISADNALEILQDFIERELPKTDYKKYGLYPLLLNDAIKICRY